MAKQARRICDTCLLAAYDECPGAPKEEQVDICLEIGGMIGEHLCDRRENSNIDCNCACRAGKGLV